MQVSIIIPCYNEETILEKSVKEIEKTMDYSRFSYEIILIDDKSKDRTVSILKRLSAEDPKLNVVYHEKNVGRGGTVSEGIRMAKGDIVGFIDIDLETPAHYILPLIQSIKDGADIATASRIYKVKLREFSVLHRWIAHKAYKGIVRLTMKTPLADTETGCKFFRKEKIIPILPQIKNNHWFWDTEIMVRSYYAGLKLTEVETLFQRKKDVPSSLKFFRDTMDYIKNIRSFRKELKQKKLI